LSLCVVSKTVQGAAAETGHAGSPSGTIGVVVTLTQMAEYDSRCRECGEMIERGEDIASVERWKGTRWEWAHARCADTAQPPAAQSTDDR